jgi:CreA protein
VRAFLATHTGATALGAKDLCRAISSEMRLLPLAAEFSKAIQKRRRKDAADAILARLRRRVVGRQHLQNSIVWRFPSMFLSNLRPLRSALLPHLGGFCVLLAAGLVSVAAAASDEPDLIFRKSTTFKFLTPNDKLATYAIDDPIVEGVACYFTLPEKGGVSGALGFAEQVSDISLACRQYGAIRIKEKFAQGDIVFRERRSFFFKKMQIVRGCDEKRNVLVYMVYSDKLVEGSPKNSTSSVPIQPWGAAADAQKCADWVKG